MDKLYSLWIIPPPKLKKHLEQIVLELSSKYKSPQFEPHMTLLGDVCLDFKIMVRKTRKLASLVKPLSLQIGEASFSTTYFQSIFVRIKSTALLMDANIKAKEVFGARNNVFMPHISLLYGKYNMKLREKIASKIVLPKQTKFIANKITIIPSTKNPSEWNHLAEINL